MIFGVQKSESKAGGHDKSRALRFQHTEYSIRNREHVACDSDESADLCLGLGVASTYERSELVTRDRDRYPHNKKYPTCCSRSLKRNQYGIISPDGVLIRDLVSKTVSGRTVLVSNQKMDPLAVIFQIGHPCSA